MKLISSFLALLFFQSCTSYSQIKNTNIQYDKNLEHWFFNNQTEYTQEVIDSIFVDSVLTSVRRYKNSENKWNANIKDYSSKHLVINNCTCARGTEKIDFVFTNSLVSEFKIKMEIVRDSFFIAYYHYDSKYEPISQRLQLKNSQFQKGAIIYGVVEAEFNVQNINHKFNGPFKCIIE